MKQIITIAVATLIFFGLAFYYHNYLNASANEITEHIIKIEDYAKNNNWEKANEEVAISNQDWTKLKDNWSMFIDHLEVDNINSSLNRVIKYVEAKSLPDVLAESSNLKLLISHIPETDKLSLKNIF